MHLSRNDFVTAMGNHGITVEFKTQRVINKRHILIKTKMQVGTKKLQVAELIAEDQTNYYQAYVFFALAYARSLTQLSDYMVREVDTSRGFPYNFKP